MDLHGRSFLKELDFTRDEFMALVDLAGRLRAEKLARTEPRCLVGANLALVFEKTSTRTRSAFEVAAHDQGAHVTYLGPGESQLGRKESVADTARVLGRMFDGIGYRGAAQDDVETLARHAGVPVWNGLTDEWHPTQMLADVLTVRDAVPRPLETAALCYLGDARNNTARSLLVTGALLGLDVRLCGPRALWPGEEVRGAAEKLGSGSGARILVTDDPAAALAGADVVYTDVWVSMGEPADVWRDRIGQLLPYQVNAGALAMTGNRDVRFMHCLPAYHDRATDVGRMAFEEHGLGALEVTDDVFESPASLVFDQAANRMPTVKAVMVATLGAPGGPDR